MKTVKYKADCFGCLPPDTIIEIPILAEESGCPALLYAPKDKNGCGCLIFAKINSDGIYEDIIDDNWINIEGTNIDPGFKKFLNTVKPPIKIVSDEDRILKQYNKKFHPMIKDAIKWIQTQKWYNNNFDLESYIQTLIDSI